MAASDAVRSWRAHPGAFLGQRSYRDKAECSAGMHITPAPLAPRGGGNCMCPGEMWGSCPSGSQVMLCSTPGHGEARAGRGPQCHTNDSSPGDPSARRRGTADLVLAASLPSPSVGPALSGPCPSLQAPAELRGRSKHSPYGESTVLPDPCPCQSQRFSLPSVSGPQAGEMCSLAVISITLPCHIV